MALLLRPYGSVCRFYHRLDGLTVDEIRGFVCKSVNDQIDYILGLKSDVKRGQFVLLLVAMGYFAARSGFARSYIWLVHRDCAFSVLSTKAKIGCCSCLAPVLSRRIAHFCPQCYSPQCRRCVRSGKPFHPNMSGKKCPKRGHRQHIDEVLPLMDNSAPLCTICLCPAALECPVCRLTHFCSDQCVAFAHERKLDHIDCCKRFATTHLDSLSWHQETNENDAVDAEDEKAAEDDSSTDEDDCDDEDCDDEDCGGCEDTSCVDDGGGMCNTCRTCRQKSRLVSLLNDRHNGKHVTGKYFGTRCPTIKVDASIASEANERFKRRLFHNATEIDSDIVTWPSWIDIPLPPVTKTNRKTRRANKRSNNPTNEQTTDVEEKKGSENTAIEKTIAKLVYRACSYCGGTDVPTSKCSVCKTARYCGKSCQELHWPSHKSDCTLKIS